MAFLLKELFWWISHISYRLSASGCSCQTAAQNLHTLNTQLMQASMQCTQLFYCRYDAFMALEYQLHVFVGEGLCN